MEKECAEDPTSKANVDGRVARSAFGRTPGLELSDNQSMNQVTVRWLDRAGAAFDSSRQL